MHVRPPLLRADCLGGVIGARFGAPTEYRCLVMP
jgi:hypothetical protein